MPAIIISEIGENHLGNMDIAIKMIQLSKEAGADYAKFQLYDANKTDIKDPERDWFFKVALSRQQVARIVKERRRLKIKPLFSCWDIERAQWCLDEGMGEIKIASFHINDKKLLSFINGHFRTVYLSTGMSTEVEIKKAVKALGRIKNLYLLHRLTEYPTKSENINLKVMNVLRKFSAHVGYSDHSLDISAILAAVANGAEVIEKHFTLSKDLPGTDHILSADPQELKDMVNQIRKIEKLLGKGKKKITSLESKNQQFLRKRFTH